MKRAALSAALGASALAVALAAAAPAFAITRDEVLARAKAFAFHPWTATGANLTAGCAPGYQSVYVPGDYVGLPYDWGGYMTLFQFDQAIAAGDGAGSYPEDGVLSCTVGLDCSGFVSKAWDTGHYTTSSIPQISSAISKADLLPGDVLNEAGYHVAMFSHVLANGEPVFYEAYGYNVHLNETGGWSHVSGYIPRRLKDIEGAAAADPTGTPAKPIVIGSFPYVDSRDTSTSKSDLLDGCGAAPGKSESGPEYVYQATFAKPGTLTVAISDDAGVDIDVHLYTSMNTNDCFARHDTTLTVQVDCGTYFIVADTFKGAAEYPGAYTLNAAFQPSGKPCGSGPPAYAPGGKMGEPCAYPGDEELPFCNPNLGADTCLYTDSMSFCSKPCAADADCTKDLPGGCCADIGDKEFYCLTSDLCGGEPPEPAGTPDAGDPSGGDAGAGAGSSAGGGPEGAGGGGGAGDPGAGGAGPGGSGHAGDPPAGAATPGARGDAAEDSGCATSAAGSSGGAFAVFVALALGSCLRRRARSAAR